MSIDALLVIVGAAAFLLPVYNLIRLYKGDARGWKRLFAFGVLAGIAEFLLFLVGLIGAIMDGNWQVLFGSSGASELAIAYLFATIALNTTVYFKGISTE